VNQKYIKEAVNENCLGLTEDLIIEISRKLRYFSRLIDRFKGMPVPFSSDDFHKRLGKQDICDYNTAISDMWIAGILGVCISISNNDNFEKVSRILGDNGYRRYNSENKQIHVWSLFISNWNRDCNDILEVFKDERGVESSFVFHPMTHNYLFLKVHKNWPIGA